jgi:hypothetical protein
MLRFAADENFNNDILDGMLARERNLDIVRIQDTEMYTRSDEQVLEWCAIENRLLLTHDASTMTHYAYERVRQGKSMPGVIEVGDEIALGQVIQDLLLLAGASHDGEWEGQVIYLPLR